MSVAHSTGSPTSRRPTPNRLSEQENSLNEKDSGQPVTQSERSLTLKKSASALSSSKFSNQAPKKIKVKHDATTMTDINPMDKLIAKLSEQQDSMSKQIDTTKDVAYARTIDFVKSTSSSVPITPATGSFDTTETSSAHDGVDTAETPQSGKNEVLRMRLELEKAKAQIARMDQELIQNRITKHTVDQVIGNASEMDFSITQAGEAPGAFQQAMNPSMRPQFSRDNTWLGAEDAQSDTSDALSAGGFNRARAIWGNGPRQQFPGLPGNIGDFQPNNTFVGTGPLTGQRSAFSQPFNEQILGFPGAGMTGFRDNRLLGDDLSMGPPRRSGGRYNARNAGGPYASSNSSYDGFTPSGSNYGSVAGMSGGAVGAMSTPMPMGIFPGGMGYPQPVGSPLSPHAPEFSSTSSQGGWKSEVSKTLVSSQTFADFCKTLAVEGQTFLPTTEPLNYRRLLDRTVNCNWKYIVDKIVCNNDQQASIFLQQKLKVGTSEQKYDIVEAIVAQAYPLMVNRFGNFLVQRCFEHGTPEQVIKIAESIRGHTLNLSMDAFGCHVVQKAFDSVPEDYKAIMVHELLRRIPETVIHRYACHVWQKLFELRWTESPPQIMKFVNEALHGMWHEVALGETGSLVVQNIFENCLEEDKRPCIEEVLASIDIVAHGQFGNWCIQHICEHGAPPDRSRAIDHVIRYASEYSMDQFASKVVEKCLKIGGAEFLGRYLDRVCEGRIDRPRIPLIDIASDQYGNYLIQYILTHSNPQHREIVAAHIRKHMVSLRGSKFGSRVGMLCTNPAFATRPGPGVGPGIGGVGAAGSSARGGIPPQQNPRFGGAYR